MLYYPHKIQGVIPAPAIRVCTRPRPAHTPGHRRHCPGTVKPPRLPAPPHLLARARRTRSPPRTATARGIAGRPADKQTRNEHERAPPQQLAAGRPVPPPGDTSRCLPRCRCSSPARTCCMASTGARSVLAPAQRIAQNPPHTHTHTHDTHTRARARARTHIAPRTGRWRCSTCAGRGCVGGGRTPRRFLRARSYAVVLPQY